MTPEQLEMFKAFAEEVAAGGTGEATVEVGSTVVRVEVVRGQATEATPA